MHKRQPSVQQLQLRARQHNRRCRRLESACGGEQGERLQLSIANCLHSRAVRRRNRRTAGDDDPLASALAAQ